VDCRGRRARKSPPSGTPCGYCFERWATVYDHLWPRSAGGSNGDDNLYPSCKRCNAFLSAKCFSTIQQKREYVRSTLIERGIWKLPRVSEEVSESTEMAEVLLPSLPMGCVEPKTPTCEQCGRSFIRNSHNQRFCSYNCGREAWREKRASRGEKPS
jgi:HNH endonuclease